jgi:hypothetical protein
VETDDLDVPGALRPHNRRAPKADPHRRPRFRSSLLSRLSRGPTAQADERSGEVGERDERASPEHGFGADVARAVRARAEFLRGLGIDTTAEGRGAALEVLERLSLARRLRQTTGHEFVSQGSGFQGQVVDRYALPPGNTYFRVVDPTGGRFTLVETRGGVAVGDRVELRVGVDGRIEGRRLAAQSRGRDE